MNIFKKIKKKWDSWYYHDLDDGEEEVWEESVPGDAVDYFADPDHRTVYVLEALGQMAEAAEKCDALQAEYDAVTGLLRDIEEIEALPIKEKRDIMGLAEKIVQIEKDRRTILKKSAHLPEDVVKVLERYEKEIPDAIEKIHEAEDYRVLVKKDLKRLDKERKNGRILKQRLYVTLGNAKGIATIIMVALLFVLGILLFMRYKFEYDVKLGYILAAGMAAVSLTVLFVKYNDAGKELKRLSKIENKLITIHNTVKIRYVNNTNLLNYYYMKYEVESGEMLAENWKIYTDEFSKRIRDEKLKEEMERYCDKLMSALHRFRVKDPEIWTRQAEALVDPREMVEVRHALNGRRQKLREQVEYNKENAIIAKNRIADLAKAYPQYLSEINMLLDKYGNPESLL
ncbi:MAG: hypothetical protein MJ105_09705 [Lachnospiraceae bacterium]|nr:hypothetical protein [Lachnospiraceae bacterium]